MNYQIVNGDMWDLHGRKEIPHNMLKGKRILVTGANGMLATYLIYYFMFLNKEFSFEIDVFALSRSEEKAKEKFSFYLHNEHFHLLKQDVCDKIQLPQGKEIDFIIHAAGNASPKFILEDPVGIIRANTIGTFNVLELARERKCSRILYTSTREVYGKIQEGITEIPETLFGSLNPTDLRACYPESKRISETILESYRHQFGIEYVTVRIAHSYGPGMNINEDGRVMSDFIADIVNNRNIILKSKGDAERAFCYITDAIAGLLIALLKGKTGQAYNLANEEEAKPIKEVAELLVKLFPEKGCKVIFQIQDNMSLGYSKMGRTKLNVDNLNKLQWNCKVKLQEGLKRTVLSFENIV